jgi:hypothetical protein
VTYNEFVMAQALSTARAEKAMMRRMSRRASQRRSLRAISRIQAKARQEQG